MATTKGAAGKSSGMNVDTKLVRELAELLNDTGLTEIEVEDGGRKIRVARGGLVTNGNHAQFAGFHTCTGAIGNICGSSVTRTDDVRPGNARTARR